MIDYWRSFADHAMVFDNGSTDNSIKILKKNAPFVEVYKFGDGKTLNDRVNKEVLNSCWKNITEPDIDFVWCCDMDEVPYVPDGTSIREWCKRMKERGETIVKPTGFQMISEKFPTYEEGKIITEQVRLSVYDKSFNKCDLFDPKQIKDINYDEGHHSCHPVGNVKWCTEPLYLLHFKFLSIDYVLSKYKDERARLSSENNKHGWGGHYKFKEQKVRDEFAKFMKGAKTIDQQKPMKLGSYATSKVMRPKTLKQNNVKPKTISVKHSVIKNTSRVASRVRV